LYSILIYGMVFDEALI